MAEIDNIPLTPVWPQTPARRIDPDEKGSEQRPRQRRRNDEDEAKNNKKDDGSSPHIDEYA